MWIKKQQLERILYGTGDWFGTEKAVSQGCLLLTCLFSLYAEHILRNARLDELQAGINVGGRSINNSRYVDDTTLGRKQRGTEEPFDEVERGG